MTTQFSTEIYPNYESALLACGERGYTSELITKVVAEKNKIFNSKLVQGILPPGDVYRSLMAVMPSLGSTEYRVLDFGGGGGYHFSLANHVIGKTSKLKWAVVETSEMCRACKELERDGLRFFDNIADAIGYLKTIDLVFSSSSLQYCPNPSDYLVQLAEVNARYLYITRTPFSKLDDEIVVIQNSMLSHNGPGNLPSQFSDALVSYPITFKPLIEIENILSMNYEIIFKFIEEDQTLTLNGSAVNAYHGIFSRLK